MVALVEPEIAAWTLKMILISPKVFMMKKEFVLLEKEQLESIKPAQAQEVGNIRSEVLKKIGEINKKG